MSIKFGRTLMFTNYYTLKKEEEYYLVGGRLFALVEDFGVFVVVFTSEERF